MKCGSTTNLQWTTPSSKCVPSSSFLKTHSQSRCLRHDELTTLPVCSANPDAASRRLVFADWPPLGYVESERAEFSRVQSELAALSSGDSRTPRLEREAEPLASSESEWARPVRHCALSYRGSRRHAPHVPGPHVRSVRRSA